MHVASSLYEPDRGRSEFPLKSGILSTGFVIGFPRIQREDGTEVGMGGWKHNLIQYCNLQGSSYTEICFFGSLSCLGLHLPFPDNPRFPSWTG